MILKEKIPFSIEIPMHGGLNKKLDSSEIEDAEFQVADKVIFDDGIAEKAPAFTKLNPANQLEGGAKIDGLHRSYSDTGTPRQIVVCNGKVFESSDWTTAIYTVLTAGKRCTFEDYHGKTIISNGYDYPVVYNPKTNVIEGTIGIESPYQLVKVAYFEIDETGWTGGTADTEIHVLDEYTGDSIQGRKLTASDGDTEAMYLTGTWDFSEFGDGGSVSDWDWIDISTFHRLRASVDTITIYFETSAGNHFSFALGKTDLDPDDLRDNEWTHHEIIRSRFTETGSPDWATITKIKIELTAEAGVEAAVTFDNWRFRKTPILAGIFRKDIATFEPSEETWTGGAVDHTNYKNGGTGLKLTDGDESAYCDKTLDLSKWINGQSIFDSDEIRIAAFVNDRSKITSITIKLGDADLTNHYYKTWLQAVLLDGTNLWNYLEVVISDMTEVGTPDLSVTERIQVEAVIAAGGEVTFDFWHAIQKGGTEGVKKDIVEVESAEAGVTWTLGTNVQWSTFQKGRGTESVQFVIWHPYSTLNAQVVLDAAIDLTQWDDASASSEDDFISFWHYWDTSLGSWVSTEILIDCNTGDFANDYYKATVTPGYLENLTRSSGPYVLYPKNEFERVGTTGGKDWSTVKGIKITVTASLQLMGSVVLYYLDDIHMRRNLGMTGKYQWKAVFRYSEVRSPASKASNWVELMQMRALLTQIPISPDSRVKVREIYRRSYGDEDFRYALTIPDNTSTEWWDDLMATTLTMAEMGVPSGTIASAKGIKVLEYRDAIVLLQDLADLKKISYTKPYYIHTWSEEQARDFPTEIVSGIVHFDSFFGFLRNGQVYRIDDDIDLGALHPLGDIIKSVSPWGICRVEEDIAILTEDDIKVFTGYQSTSIGENIAPYLDPADYATEEGILFYHQNHLYYAVETRAGGSYKLLDCYVPKMKWEDRGLSANCFCAYTGRGDQNELVYGGYDGYVYQLGTTYNHSMTIRSKDIGEVATGKGKGFLFHEKELQEIRIIAKGGDVTSGALTLKVYTNGADSGISKTIPSAGHLDTVYHTYVIPLTGVEDVAIGQLLGIDIAHTTATKNAFIKAVMLNGMVIPLEQEFTDE